MKSAKWENIFKGWNSSESATVHTLKQVPIFKELTDKEFNELEKLIHHRKYNEGDFLVFGSETSGIDEKFLRSHWENACTIPMNNPNIRSLNLATSVGIVVYEALRQISHD